MMAKSRIPEQTLAVFEALPDTLASRLGSLRKLILKTADENTAIGALTETLKWGEPAFLTSATKSGTTVRINRHKKNDAQYAMYVSCQTDLVDHYKQLYDDVLTFDGNRAVVFSIDEPLPVDAVTHCVTMALTYHLRSRLE